MAVASPMPVRSGIKLLTIDPSWRQNCGHKAKKPKVLPFACTLLQASRVSLPLHLGPISRPGLVFRREEVRFRGSIRGKQALIDAPVEAQERKPRITAKAGLQTGDTSTNAVKRGTDSAVKQCASCQYTKELVDFQRTDTTMDGLADSCRACSAVVRAKRGEGEMHHLALTAEEAWELAKACRKCGPVKELRDFAKDATKKDGTVLICRACVSARWDARRTLTPTDEPQECVSCQTVKAADEFCIDRKSANGRRGRCKTCEVERVTKYNRRMKEVRIYVRRDKKRCSRCREEKKISDFHVNAWATDGRREVCSTCAAYASKEQWAKRNEGA